MWKPEVGFTKISLLNKKSHGFENMLFKHIYLIITITRVWINSLLNE